MLTDTIFIIENKKEVYKFSSYDWFIYAYARTYNYNWLIDKRFTMNYRQHEHNEKGAHIGFNATANRIRNIRSGWYAQEIWKLAKIFNHSEKAARGSDVIFTDKVVSMNDKVNKINKIKSFKKFKVTSKIMKCAKKDTIFLHCLPRGSEVSNDVFLGKQSKVFQQALNRIYVQKSILLYCFEKLR